MFVKRMTRMRFQKNEIERAENVIQSQKDTMVELETQLNDTKAEIALLKKQVPNSPQGG